MSAPGSVYAERQVGTTLHGSNYQFTAYNLPLYSVLSPKENV